jgi:hypothetical protein
MIFTINPTARKKEEEPRPPAPTPPWDRDTVIAEMALSLWERAGQPRGQWEVFWLAAEREVILRGPVSGYNSP